MQELVNRFYIFINSSFSRKEKARLFEFIWNHYHQKIGFYISNLIPFDNHSFDDVFQEVMIKIYRNLHTFNPLHSFKAWIYTIVRNHCLDFLKNKSRSLYQSNEIEIEKVQDPNTPEKTFIQQEMHDMIDHYIQSLEPIDREIAYLRFYENIRYKDIGKILDVNVNTVKSKARQIRLNISKNLNK